MDSESTEPLVGRLGGNAQRGHGVTKSRCACQWGGWGRISGDGPGQKNPDRSEDPWGRAVGPLAWRCWPRTSISDTDAESNAGNSEYAGRKQTGGMRDVGIPRGRLLLKASLEARLGKAHRTQF